MICGQQSCSAADDSDGETKSEIETKKHCCDYQSSGLPISFSTDLRCHRTVLYGWNQKRLYRRDVYTAECPEQTVSSHTGITKL